MNMNIKIPVNRKRFPSVLIVSLLLTLAGIYFINRYIDDGTQNAGYLSYWILAIPLYYLFLSLPDYFKTIFDKNAGLVISDTDINDNLSIFSCGKIERNDVRDVQIMKAFNTEFLIIKLFDNNKYLSSHASFKRPSQNVSIRKYGSPVVISQTRINFELSKLKDLILEWKNSPDHQKQS